MAKRWLTAKRLKVKTYRARARGVMKKFSSERINVGMPPNREIMQWYKNAATSLKHGLVDMREMMHYNSNEPRKEAQALKHEIEEACPKWMYFRLVDDAWLRARMYFQLNPERCCVLEYDPRRNTYRRSIEYKSKDRAYQRWCSGTIDWVEPSQYYHPNIPETGIY